MKKDNEKVILVYASEMIDDEEIEETKELIEACELQLITIFTQRLKEITFATYLGKGKTQEIATYLEEQEIDRVIVQQDLSPLQLSNLESIWGVPVIDRSELIVDIFAKRAKSKEAKLQVESARLKKLLPRLIGANTSLGRQGGGKNRGTGEKQLEVDRRRIKANIREVERELKEVKTKRSTQRNMRNKHQIFQVALVGYTNAGKSTLMNALLETSLHTNGQQVLEQDMLFATLDTSVRKIRTSSRQEFLLFDTVGFVSHLPHVLVKAFHSTLEEIMYADLLIQVIDCSSTNASLQMEVTKQTLHELHADHIPMLHVFNKSDKTTNAYPNVTNDGIYISAKDKHSITTLLTCIEQHLYGDYIPVTLEIPYIDSGKIPAIMKEMIVEKHENMDNVVQIIGKMAKSTRLRYIEYVK